MQRRNLPENKSQSPDGSDTLRQPPLAADGTRADTPMDVPTREDPNLTSAQKISEKITIPKTTQVPDPIAKSPQMVPKNDAPAAPTATLTTALPIKEIIGAATNDIRQIAHNRARVDAERKTIRDLARREKNRLAA